MRNTCNESIKKSSYFLSAIFFGFLVIIPWPSFASDLSGHLSRDAGKNDSGGSAHETLSPGHRLIEGTVEAINENSIKVDAGDAGELTPRYPESQQT